MSVEGGPSAAAEDGSQSLSQADFPLQPLRVTQT